MVEFSNRTIAVSRSFLEANCPAVIQQLEEDVALEVGCPTCRSGVGVACSRPHQVFRQPVHLARKMKVFYGAGFQGAIEWFEMHGHRF